MEGSELICVSSRQFEDLVYFTLPPKENAIDESIQEPQVLTHANESPNLTQFLSKDEVHDPLLSLFRIEYCNDYQRREISASQTGCPLKPGDHFILFHVFTESKLSCHHDNGNYRLEEDALAGLSPLSLILSSARPMVDNFITDEDRVYLTTQVDSIPFRLGADLSFHDDSGVQLVIQLYEKSTRLDDISVRYGQVQKLQNNEQMYLSVLPNSENSATLLLSEEEMKDSPWNDQKKWNYPEYYGDLKADFTTDPDDVNNYWIFEKSDRFQGGGVLYGEEFYLKHVASGRYLKNDMSLDVKRSGRGRSGDPFKFPKSSINPEKQAAQAEQEPDHILCYEEFNSLVTDGTALLSLDSGDISSIQSELFLSVIGELAQDTVLRMSVCSSKDGDSSRTVSLAVRQVPVERGNELMTMSLFAKSLSRIRLMLQNFPNSEAALKECAKEISCYFLTDQNDPISLRPNLSSDDYFVHELVRINCLKWWKNIDFKVLDELHQALLDLIEFESAMSYLLQRKAFMNAMLKVAAPYLAKLLTSTIWAHPPSSMLCQYWAEQFMSTIKANPKDKKDLIKMAISLLKGLDETVMVDNGECLKNEGVYILTLVEKRGIYTAVQGEKDIKDTDEIGFILELAAAVCNHCPKAEKELIIRGMGLELKPLIEFYKTEIQTKVRPAALYFIAEVHLPELKTRKSLTSIIENPQSSDLIDFPEYEGWLYLPNEGPEINELIKLEANFWLQQHQQEPSKKESRLFDYLEHFTFITHMIEYGAVSKMYVASMTLCAIDLTQRALSNDIRDFPTQFSRERAEKRGIINSCLEVIAAYQRMRQVQVLKAAYQRSRQVQALKAAYEQTKTAQVFQAASAAAAAVAAKTADIAIHTVFDSFSLDAITAEDPRGSSEEELQLKSLLDLLREPNIKTAPISGQKVLQPKSKIRPELDIEHFLLRIATKTGQGDNRKLLDLMDNEAGFEYPQAPNEDPMNTEFVYALASLETRQVSLRKLEFLDSKEEPLLKQYIDSLQKLCDYMIELRTDQRKMNAFQFFLSKVEFSKQLEWAWNCCTAIDPTHSETPLSVDLRTVTIDLSRLYIENNELHHLDLLKMLLVEACYLDYPVYISLLIELRLIKSGGKCVGNIAKMLFEKAHKSKLLRPLVALSVLLEDDQRRRTRVLYIANSLYSGEKDKAFCEQLEIVFHPNLEPLEFYKENPEGAKSLAYLLAENRQKTTAMFPHQDLSLSYKTIISTLIVTILQKKSYPACRAMIRKLMTERTLTLNPLTPGYMSYFEGVTKETETPEQLSKPSISNEYLKRLFKYKKSYLDYMEALHLGVDHLTKEIKDSQQYYIQLIEELIKVTIEHKTRRVVDLALKILCKLVGNERISTEFDIRSAVLETLKSHRLYLRFFQTFWLHLGYRSRLKEKIKRFPIRQYIWEFKLRDANLFITHFLQLLEICCDGCNTDFQHFLRTQSQDAQNSFNLVSRTTELAEELIRQTDRDSREEKMLNQCLDTLKEATTGPCLENQIEICKHIGFLETVTSIVQKSHLDPAKLESDMQQDLLKEVMELMHALVEGHERDYPYFRTSMKSINFEDFYLLFTRCAEVIKNEKILRELTLTPLTKSVINKEAQDRKLREKECPRKQNSKSEEYTEEVEKRLSRPYSKALPKDVKDKEEKLFEEPNVEAEKTKKTSDSMKKSQISLSHIFDLSISCMIFCYLAWDDEEKMRDFYKHEFLKYIAIVEVQLENNKIKTLAFKVPFQCLFLTRFTAERLLSDLDRGSRQEQLNDFSKKAEICNNETKYQQKLSRSSSFTAFIGLWRIYWYLSFAFVVLINIVLLCTVEKVSKDNLFNINPDVLRSVLRPLSLMQAVLMFAGTFSYYVEYGTTIYNPLKLRETTFEMNELPTISNPGSLDVYFKKKSTTNTIESDKEKNQGFSCAQVSRFLKQIDRSESMLLLVRLTFLALACVSVSFPILYPILLLQIWNLCDAVVNILKSVTEHYVQLIVTLVFSVIAIYLFTFVAYFEYSGYYSESIDSLYCDTLFDCFVSTLNMGMRSGGGIGDAFGPPKFDDFYSRAVFDLLFYGIIIVILMAIVFGIIVDAFSELRDGRNQLETEMHNVCMICGKNRSVIEVKGEGWRKHTQLVHNPFSYLYFLIHLYYTHPDDCTGLEKKIKDKLKDKEFDFYPTTSSEIGFGEDE